MREYILTDLERERIKKIVEGEKIPYPQYKQLKHKIKNVYGKLKEDMELIEKFMEKLGWKK